VLYEMLAGEPPFTGSSARAIIARHMQEPAPDVRVVRPDVPIEVSALLERMLAKAPSDRFADADTLLGAVADPWGAMVAEHRQRQRTGMSGARAMTLVVASAALVGLVAWWLVRLTS
jgi:serine/threonine protein kinase